MFVVKMTITFVTSEIQIAICRIIIYNIITAANIIIVAEYIKQSYIRSIRTDADAVRGGKQ